MKITFTLLLLSLLLSFFSKGQQKFPVTDKYGQPWNYGIGPWPSKKTSVAISISADKQTKFISPFNTIVNDPRGYLVYLVGATTVNVTAMIKRDSLSYYRYSIFENDTTLIQSNAKLSKVDFVWPDHSDHPGYLTMNFGISDIQEKKITIKLYRLPREDKVTTLIIYNKHLNSAKLIETNLLREARIIKTYSNFIIPIVNKMHDVRQLKNGIRFSVDKKTRGIRLVMKKTDLDFAYQITLKNTSSDKYNTVFLSNSWTYDRPDENPSSLIPASYFSEPGCYQLSVRPMVKDLSSTMTGVDSNAIMISFIVARPSITFSIIEAIVGIVFIAVLTAVIFYIIRRSNKKKLLIANLQAEFAKSELSSVRSQLNPHFVFNALAGIQNLMNQNEVEKANGYLSKFARLTRNILDGKQLIALKDEHKLLEDYLAMERLRFNFNYEIGTNLEPDILEVMIPTMLLQPFLENAVKHSMAILGEKGTLLVEFKSVSKDLILSIKDNGKGFDTQKVHKGLGLSLCKKRIDLLNQIYTECPITMDLSSGPDGTTVIIKLNNWL